MSVEEQDEQQKGFKIRDKRRFRPDGEERTSSDNSAISASEKESSKDERAKEIAQSKAEYEGSTKSLPSSIDFSSFIMSLGSQTLWQMGLMESPEGVEIPVDMEAARQTLDILGIISEKTAGNLEPSERKLLDNILHELRLGYVRMKTGGGGTS